MLSVYSPIIRHRCLTGTERTFSLHRWKSETVGLRCDCGWIHLNSLCYCINIPALVRTPLFCFSAVEKCFKIIEFAILSFLFLVHRQRPPRLLLLRRRSPWPWPTTVTWTCKQTRIPHAHREALSLQTGVSLPSDRWLMTISPPSPQEKKQIQMLKVGGSLGTFLPHRKQRSSWLSVFFFVSYWCGEGWNPQRLLMRFKDKTTEHLTLSHQCRIFVRGNVTRLLGKRAFLFRTQNKQDALCTTLVLIHFGFVPTFLVF